MSEAIRTAIEREVWGADWKNSFCLGKSTWFRGGKNISAGAESYVRRTGQR